MKYFFTVLFALLLTAFAFAQSGSVNIVSQPAASALDSAPVIDPQYVVTLHGEQKQYLFSRQVFFLKDAAHRLSFSDVMASDSFTRYEGDEINFGYNPAHYWLKFHVKNSHPDLDDWLIELSYPLLDSIEFYYRDKDQLWKQVCTGDMLPFQQRPIPYRYFMIPLHHPDTVTRTYYLKVATKGIVRVPLEITSTQDFYRENIKAELAYGLFYGIMIVMMLYNLVLFFSLRDFSYLYYVGAILGSSLLIASLSGHVYQHLLPAHPWWAANMVTCSMGIWLIAASAFARNFLYTDKYARFLSWMFNGVMIFGGLIMALSFVVDYNVMSRLATSSSTVNCFLLIISGIVCWMRGNQSARYFVIAWTVYVVGLVMLAFRNFGFVPANALTAHGAEVGAVAEVILLALALSDKYTLMRLEKKKAQEDTLRIQREANEALEQKVIERTAEINQQKEEIEAQRDNLEKVNQTLEQKNAEIEAQRDSMEIQTRELEKSYLIIQETNRHITDSIRYAKTIQQAILPHSKQMDEVLGEYFVIFRPKDIVSGDFYWFSHLKNRTFIAAVDCTGHGVPGAFMSMIGNTLLNEIVNQKHIFEPGQVLEHLNEEIRTALKQKEQSNDDGMDVCFCSLEKLDNGHTRVVFAGAKRPLYFTDSSSQQLYQRKGDRRAIGGKLRKETETPFTNYQIELPPGSVVYLMSDGLVDQNDPENQKFGLTEFENLVAANVGRTMEEQKFIIENALDMHQRGAAQRDDITLIGIKI